VASWGENSFMLRNVSIPWQLFPIWAWIQTNSIESWFVIVIKIISVRFENHSGRTSTAGLHKPRANLFCTVIPNTCSSSLWNIFPVNFPVDGIFMWSLHFCKVWKYLVYTVWNRTKNKCCYHNSVLLIKRHLLPLFERTQHINGEH